MPGTIHSVGLLGGSGSLLGGSGSLLGGSGSDEGPKKPSLLGSVTRAITGIPGGLFQLGSDIVRLPFVGIQSVSDGDFGERFPAIFGMGKGFETTAHHLNPMEIGNTVEDYQGDPVGMLLNEVGNISTVASGGLAAAGKAGLLAGTAGGRTATIAARVERAAQVGNKVADLPLAPWRFAGTRALEAVGKRAETGLNAGRSTGLNTALVRFSPNSKALNSSLRQGSAAERQATGSMLLDEGEAGTLRQDLRHDTAESVSRLPFAQTAAKVPTGELDEAGQPILKLDVPEGFKSLQSASRGMLGSDSLAKETILPNSLAGVVGRHFSNGMDLPGAKALHQVLSPTNRAYRMLRMDLNPGWAVGQVPGNASMIGLQSPTPVRDVGRYVRRLVDGKFVDDPRVIKSGGSAVSEDIAQGAGSGSFVDRTLTGIEDKVKKGRLARLADWADNASRSAFYEGRIADGHSPEVAREMTLRSLGEFDSAGPVERGYIAPSVPFYKWSREIVRMTGHLAEDHPVRFAQAANLGNQNETRQGDVKPGERTVDGGFLVPYGQSGDSFKGTVFGIGKKLGPVPKVVAMLGTGKSMSSGKDLLAGQAFGQSNTPGLHNIDEASRTVLQGLPIGRLGMAARGENRYQTSREAAVGYLTGIDLSHSPTESQLQAEREGRAEKRATAADARKIRRLTEEAVAGR